MPRRRGRLVEGAAAPYDPSMRLLCTLCFVVPCFVVPCFAVLGSACGGSSTATGSNTADDVMGPADGEANHRSPWSSGSFFTVGLRVALGGPVVENRVRLEAVVVDVDGNESVTDLGEYVGQPIEQAPEGDELGHLRLTLGDEVHHLTLSPTDDPTQLELRLDGAPVRRLELPRPETVGPGAPFLLQPPSTLE